MSEREAQNERAQVFYEGRFPAGNWGWQCFACGAEETRFGNATTAREEADNHEALGCDPVDMSTPDPDPTVPKPPESD